MGHADDKSSSWSRRSPRTDTAFPQATKLSTEGLSGALESLLDTCQPANYPEPSQAAALRATARRNSQSPCPCSPASSQPIHAPHPSHDDIKIMQMHESPLEGFVARRLAPTALMLGKIVTGALRVAPAGMLNELSESLEVSIRTAGMLITFGGVVLW